MCQWAGGSDKQSKQMLKQRQDCVTTHSLVPCIFSVTVFLLPQTHPDTDYMSLVLIAVQQP